MDKTEQNIIDELFEKLGEAEQGSAQRDAGAERHINNLISRQPSAPYYMAQAIIVQEQALKQAQQRIEELENEVDERPAAGGGSFLGGLFGGGGSVPRSGAGATPGARYPRQNAGRQAESPVAQYQRTGQGGGFLAGAAQTAVGVAGGMMLGSMLGGMFGGGDKATAAEAPKEEANAEQTANADTGAQDADNDGGGWFDGGGDDFDI